MHGAHWTVGHSGISCALKLIILSSLALHKWLKEHYLESGCYFHNCFVTFILLKLGLLWYFKMDTVDIWKLAYDGDLGALRVRATEDKSLLLKLDQVSSSRLL